MLADQLNPFRLMVVLGLVTVVAANMRANSTFFVISTWVLFTAITTVFFVKCRKNRSKGGTSRNTEVIWILLSLVFSGVVVYTMNYAGTHPITFYFGGTLGFVVFLAATARFRF